MDIIKKNLRSDRYLVAEQPGLSVLLTGLILSFIVGYTFKSYFSPSRVSSLMTRVAQSIHKEIVVNFNSAELSLSDGIFPRFSVVVRGIQIESPKKCWGSPLLQVNELELPLAFFSYLSNGPLIKTIDVRKMKLTLRDVLSDCEEEISSAKSSSSASPLVQLSPAENKEKYQRDVQGLTIEDLSIAADKYAGFSLDLQNFKAKVKSTEPRVVEVEAKTHLLKSPQGGDYLSHANLYMQYQESPQMKIQSHFFGNWREGHYSLIANYLLDEKRLSMEADLKHIPLSQILGILQRYKLASQELNGRQTWISTKATLSGPVEDLRRSPMEVRDLRLEGDIGDVKVDQIKIQSLEPFKYSPIHVQIDELKIGKLLILLNRPAHSNTLGELGTFSGRAEIQSENKILLRGEHSGLEFVFSSRGQRELQVVDRMVGDIQYLGNKWNFAVQRIEPRAGNFIGQIRMTADRDFQNLELKAQVDEVVLDPKVQSLMTNGGEIGPLSLDIDAHMSSGKLTQLKGLARLDDLSVEGLSLDKVKTSFNWSHDELQAHTMVKSAQIESNSSVGRVLNQITLPGWWRQEGLTLHDVSGVFATKNLNTLSWKRFIGHAGKTGKLMTEGSWDADGKLKGFVQNREAKTQRSWSIQGERDKPLFEEANP